MDKYFFHIDYGEHSRDTEGTPFPDVAAARDAAVKLLGELLKDEADNFWAKPNITVTVADVRGLTLWTIETVGQESPSVSVRR